MRASATIAERRAARQDVCRLPWDGTPWCTAARSIACRLDFATRSWRQGRPASHRLYSRLEIRNGGQASLLVTFPLHSPLPLPSPSPHPCAPLAPSATPAPFPTRPIPPLFPEGTAPPGYAKAASGRVAPQLQVLAYTLLPPPMPLPSNRLRRSFRKATMMRAAKAASSLSPPLPGTLRAVATISCSKLLELAAAGKPASPTPAPTDRQCC